MYEPQAEGKAGNFDLEISTDIPQRRYIHIILYSKFVEFEIETRSDDSRRPRNSPVKKPKICSSPPGFGPFSNVQKNPLNSVGDRHRHIRAPEFGSKNL